MHSQFTRKVMSTLLLINTAFVAHAQTVPDAGSLLRESERQNRQLPKPGVQAVPQAPAAKSQEGLRVVVKAFKLTGHTLINEAELQAVLTPWVGRESTFGELEQAANAIAEAYRQRGWFARTQLPAQDITEGVISINIIEGKLGAVLIDDGGKTLRVERAMVNDTMTARQQPGDPLNLDSLERSSNILNDTPGVAVVTVLAAGKGPAEADAVVKVADKPLLAATVQLDNTGSRSTGEKKLTVNASLDNPSGRGDQANLNANASEGSTYLRLAYSLPFGNDGLRVGANTSALTYKLVGPDFAPLKSLGDAQTYGINASYPLMRSATRNIVLSGNFDRKNFNNQANDVNTSRKQIYVGLISLTGDLLDGLGAGGMTLWGLNLTSGHVNLSGNLTNQSTDGNGPRTEGNYTKLGANLARLQRLADKATLWASFNAQWAGKNLDSSEKMSLGGPSGVRAYPVSEALGDEGWLASIEGRYNLMPQLQVTAFYGHGYIRRDHDSNYTGALMPTTGTLKGNGLSLNWTQAGSYVLRATWARRIGDNPFRTLATGRDQDGSFDKNRLWLTAMVFF